MFSLADELDPMADSGLDMGLPDPMEMDVGSGLGGIGMSLADELDGGPEDLGSVGGTCSVSTPTDDRHGVSSIGTRV